MTRTDNRKSQGAYSRSVRLLTSIGFMVGLLLSCAWLLTGCDQQPEEDVSSTQADTQQEPTVREVILYFSAPDGSRLVAEHRLVEGCFDETECIQAVVAALAAGPADATAAVLPTAVVLQALSMDGSLASLDFNAAFVTAHPGGTRSELLSIYALVDTLAANFPHLRQFNFLVDGAPIETIKGHVDLRQPITPDFSLVQEMSAAAGDLSNVPARSE